MVLSVLEPRPSRVRVANAKPGPVETAEAPLAPAAGLEDLSEEDLAMPQVGIPPAAALRIYAIEFAFYGGLLGLCLLWRARHR